MILPPELLLEIASYLSAKDLANCRSVCKLFAALGLRLIPRNGLNLIDTSQGFNDLLEILRYTDVANNTRTLTIYTTEWHHHQRSEWETQYFISHGQSRIRDGLGINAAYSKYKRFIEQENRRTHHSDVQAFIRAFCSLPELESITICPLKDYGWNQLRCHKYSKLQKETGVSPCFNTSVNKVVQRLLEALRPNSPSIRKLSIRGSLDIVGLQVDWLNLSFSNIQYLEIQSLNVFFNEESVREFLLAFPNLVELCLGFWIVRPSTYTFLGTLSWKFLKLLKLQTIQSTEDDVFNLVNNHAASLAKFSIRDSYLALGSWESLFTRIRNLQLTTEMEAEGKLYESSKTTAVYRKQKPSLAKFLTDSTVAWPFS